MRGSGCSERRTLSRRCRGVSIATSPTRNSGTCPSVARERLLQAARRVSTAVGRFLFRAFRSTSGEFFSLFRSVGDEVTEDFVRECVLGD